MSETRMFPGRGPGAGLTPSLSEGLCFSRKSGLLSDVLQYCI